MGSPADDVRVALRQLVRNPGLIVVALATLAVAMWANVGIFSVVHAILLKSLPYRDPSRIVVISEAFPQMGFGMGTFAAADFHLFQRQQTSFESVAAIESREYELSGRERPQHVIGARVTASLFPLLGVDPALGRTFTPEEDGGRVKVVVLSHDLWSGRYGRDEGILGKQVTIDRASYHVIGVMPAGFRFPLPGPTTNNQPADLWLPMGFGAADLVVRGGPFNYTVFGRLRREKAVEAAAAETAALASRIQEHYPAVFATSTDGANLELRTSEYAGQVVGNVRLLLLLLAAIAGVVLTIACANLGALLLSRGIQRRKEMATRAALGAGQGVLLRQLFVENLLLAVIGGGLGWLLAVLSRAWFVPLLPPNIPIPNDIELGGAAVIFTLLMSLLACVLFGLAPALLIRRSHLAAALHESGRTASASRGGRRMQSALVVAELALAVGLLVVAGLLLRSFNSLTAVDPGFRPERVLTVSLPLPARSYASGSHIRSFYEQAFDTVAALPDVASVGLTSDSPLHARNTGSFAMDGRPQGANTSPPSVHLTWMIGDYLKSLGVPLVRGRWLTAEDRGGSQAVALLNATMARQFWPGEDPLGKRVRWAAGGPWMTIVGIVGDVRYDSLKTAPGPHVYKPFLQEADGFIASGLRNMKLVIRTRNDPSAVVRQVENAIGQLDRHLALADVRTLEQDLSASVARERFTAVLVSVFAGLATFLAIAGVYSVIAFSVAQQTGDIGLRMALGAQRSHIMRLILAASVRLSMCGVAFGLAGAWALARYLRSLLFGISTTDPLAFASAPAVLLAIALLGASIPAWRAARVDPVEALREG